MTPEERTVSPLLSAAGALAGAVVAVAAVAAERSPPLLARAVEAFSGRLDPATAAGSLVGELGGLVLPVAGGAFVGALLVGMAQTRGRLRLRARLADRRERQTMPWALAAALMVAVVMTARAVAPSLARTEGLAAALSSSWDALARLAPRALLLFFAAGLADWALGRLGRDRAENGERDRDRADPRLAAERRRRQRS